MRPQRILVLDATGETAQGSAVDLEVKAYTNKLSPVSRTLFGRPQRVGRYLRAIAQWSAPTAGSWSSTKVAVYCIAGAQAADPDRIEARVVGVLRVWDLRHEDRIPWRRYFRLFWVLLTCHVHAPRTFLRNCLAVGRVRKQVKQYAGDRPIILVSSIAVDPEFQRQGIRSRLLESVLVDVRGRFVGRKPIILREVIDPNLPRRSSHRPGFRLFPEIPVRDRDGKTLGSIHPFVFDA